MTLELDWHYNAPSGIRAEIEALGIDLDRCLECGKCSGGCSNAHVFDYTPRKIVQLVKLGAEKTLLTMDALWLCVNCQLCLERCPSGIDVPRLLDHLRCKARQRGVPPSRPHVERFLSLMLDEIRRNGRINELPLMVRYIRATGGWRQDAGLGMRMFLKGKLPLALNAGNRGEIRELCERVRWGKRP